MGASIIHGNEIWNRNSISNFIRWINFKDIFLKYLTYRLKYKV